MLLFVGPLGGLWGFAITNRQTSKDVVYFAAEGKRNLSFVATQQDQDA